jgi:hypothetical protein
VCRWLEREKMRVTLNSVPSFAADRILLPCLHLTCLTPYLVFILELPDVFSQ